MSLHEGPCDALVFFGATGDLAYKKIFPALQAMVKRGHLDVPVIGVAQHRLDARSTARPGPGQHREAWRRRRPGRVREAGRPVAIRRRRVHRSRDVPGAAQDARRRAASRPLSRDSADALRRRSWSSSAAPAARQERASSWKSPSVTISRRRARSTGSCCRHSTSSTSFASTTISASGRCTTWCSSASRTRSSSRSGIAITFESVQITMAESFGVAGPRHVLRPDRHHPRRGAEPPVPGAGEPRDGGARAHWTANRCATRRSRC